MERATLRGRCWKRFVLIVALAAATLLGTGALGADTVQAKCYNQGHGAAGTTWC